MLLLDLESGKVLRVFRGEVMPEKEYGEGGPPSFTSVAFSLNGRFGLAGNLDGFIRYWDLTTGREEHRFSNRVSSYSDKPQVDRVYDVAISSHGYA